MHRNKPNITYLLWYPKFSPLNLGKQDDFGPLCWTFLDKADRDQSEGINALTHWVQVTHICVSKLTIIGPDNGLSPGRRQAIVWTNAGILLIRTLGTNSSEILAQFIHFH